MKSLINPNHGNQSEVGDLKAGPLEYKAEAQFQPLFCNFLFSQMGVKFYNFLNIRFLMFPSRRLVEQTDKIKGRKLAHSSGHNSCWTREAEPFLRTTKIHHRVHFSRSLEIILSIVNYRIIIFHSLLCGPGSSVCIATD